MAQRGYLANWKNVPPLIFRFQFNPELLQEKKSFKYNESESGSWDFSNTSEDTGPWYTRIFTTPYAVYKDLKEIGPKLVNTRGLSPETGGQRTFAIDFQLDSSVVGEGVTAGNANPYGGTIEPDLAILRSFMVPSADVIDLIKGIAGRGDESMFKPPECTLIYGGLSVDCVMENLNIKITAFNPDHTPQRAEVSVTLKQQTKSISPVLEHITRNVDVGKSYVREGFGEDYLNVLPGVSAVRHIFEI